MAEQLNHSKILEAVELIANKGFSGMTEAMEILFNQAMLIERSRDLGVGAYERSELRQDHANGFKPKQLKTTLGELSLRRHAEAFTMDFLSSTKFIYKILIDLNINLIKLCDYLYN